ncbi:MAG: ATP synthase subunit C [Spirochaetaceae bacterium]|nr:ATP synthase subunit C [Spirochaetaceae bacterium]
MKKKLTCAASLLIGAAVLFAAEGEGGTSGAPSALAAFTAGSAKYFAAAIAVGISCLAGGIAVGRIGAAAMGAISENAELAGKAIPYVGLAEGICLWGFLVALLMIIL